MAEDGYFPKDSALRMIGRESVLLLGGGRALLMQVAHPQVANIVHEHSDYERNPWGRLARTMVGLYTVVHGTCEEADRVAAQVRAVHAHMRCEDGARSYAAGDPELMLWVHATLVDTGLTMYEAFVGPLSAAVKEAFYADMTRAAELYGIPSEVLPRSFVDFEEYLRSQLRDGSLCVGREAREIARVVLRPPVPLLLRPGFAAISKLTAALLPVELREQYGISGGPTSRLALAAAARTARHLLLPMLPTRLRSLEPRAGHPVSSVASLRLLAALGAA